MSPRGRARLWLSFPPGAAIHPRYCITPNTTSWRSTRSQPSTSPSSGRPIQRFNRGIGRRTDVVGIFPDDPSVIRLVSMLAIEANDEWLVGRGYISCGSMATLYETQTDTALPSRSEQEVPELAA